MINRAFFCILMPSLVGLTQQWQGNLDRCALLPLNYLQGWIVYHGSYSS